MRSITSPLTLAAGFSPVIRMEPRPVGTSNSASAGGVQPHIFNGLGYYQEFMMPKIAQQYGRQYLYLEQMFRDIFKHEKKFLLQDTIRNRQGKDIICNGTVLSCLSSAGTALPTVTLEVTGWKSNGIPTTLPFWDKGMKIYNGDGRPFVIIDIGTSPAGNQSIVVQPLGNFDMTVAGAPTNCVQFPTGSNFNPAGRISLDATACSCSFDHLQMTQDEWDSWTNIMSRYEYKWGRNRETLQRTIRTIDFEVEVEGFYKSARLYLEEQDHIELARVFMEANAELFFGQGNTNPNIASRQGWGLVPQIAQELRFNYTPGGTGSGRISYRKLRDFFKEYKLNNNNYVGNELYMLCGSDLYAEIQTVLETETTMPIYWADAMTSKEETDRSYWLGRNIKGMHTFQGVNVVFMEYRAFNELWAGAARPSYVNPNRSINSHLGLVIDPSPMTNLNIETRMWENVPQNKVDCYGRKTENGDDISMILQKYEGGNITYEGKINKNPIVDENCAYLKMEINQMVNLQDLSSVAMFAPEPQLYAAV